MPIRILHIIGSLRLGGAQVVVKQLVEHNDDPNIEHVVYPLRSQKIDIPINGTIIKLDYPNYDPRKFFAIFSLCKQYNIDIIHAHLHKPIVAALLARYFMKTPVLVHEHGSISYLTPQYLLYQKTLRLLRNKAERYIAVSNSIEKDLERYSKISPSSIDIIYNAADLEQFSPDPGKRQSLREQLNITPDDIVIGFIGRINPVKGADILLDAFEILMKENPKYKLVYVGDGPAKQPLIETSEQRGLSERVNFLGFREDVAEVMNIFDIGCMPSLQEPFGIAALEMMSMQIPLVCSGIDGLAEFVTNGKNALVPIDNTPKHIADCIKQLADNRELCNTLIENAQHDVQKFSISHLVHQVNGIYREIKNSGTH